MRQIARQHELNVLDAKAEALPFPAEFRISQHNPRSHVSPAYTNLTPRFQPSDIIILMYYDCLICLRRSIRQKQLKENHAQTTPVYSENPVHSNPCNEGSRICN